MSLRGRLLLLMVLLNLLVLGVIYAAVLNFNQGFLEREGRRQLQYLYEQTTLFVPEGARFIARPEFEQKVVRDVLGVSYSLRFDDLMISGGDDDQNFELNPLGASHRDPDTFPLAEIRAAMARAVRERRTVPVAGGYCTALTNDAGRGLNPVIWIRLPETSAPRIQILALALPVALSVLLFAGLGSWIIARTLGRPLTMLGTAARQVAEGEYGARAPQLDAPELKPLVESFNTMAVKVQAHTGELQREVQRATEEAAARERAMIVASRLASMGTLAAGVAHEINNPIGGMLNAANRLAKSEHLEPRERQYLEMIQRGLSRVAGTARKLLDFTPKVVEPVPFVLAEVIEEARGLVEHRLLRQGVALELELDELPGRLVGDPAEIQQVLINLLLNALNALEGQAQGRIRIHAAAAGPVARIRVTDNGPGVDEATLARVLDPFFSSSQAPDSTGLGLFISYTILQNHNGDLAVASRPGEGFEVTLSLPLEQPGSA